MELDKQSVTSVASDIVDVNVDRMFKDAVKAFDILFGDVSPDLAHQIRCLVKFSDTNKRPLMHPLFTSPIRDFAGMSWFFWELHKQDLLFHPEDDPADISVLRDGRAVNDGIAGDCYRPLFSKEEAEALTSRLIEAFDVSEIDPCTFVWSTFYNPNTKVV